MITTDLTDDDRDNLRIAHLLHLKSLETRYGKDY